MSLSAVLLCGGESRRMGSDKSLVEWKGVPLWQLQLEKLRALAVDELFVSARSDKQWRPRDVRLVLDATEARGPISGIAAALHACKTDHLLVLAIDLPSISADYLAAMAQRVRGGVGVVPAINGRFEPVAAIYPRDVADEFHAKHRSLQVLVRELVDRGAMEEFEVHPADRELFCNVNEPADLIRS